jgi:hypothetical protein
MEKRGTRDLDTFDPRELPWAHGQGAVVAALQREYQVAEMEWRFADGAVFRNMARSVAAADPQRFEALADMAMRGL